MASTTPIYGLVTGVVGGDLIEPDHHNRVADSLDRVLGGVLSGLLNAGACKGWEIRSDGTVSPGCGLVAACWCQTEQAQAISSLSAGATNYVFACTTVQSAPAGEVAFVGQASPEGPSGAVYLGTIEVDTGGMVTQVNNHAPGVQRQCHPLRWGVVSGSGVAEAVAPGDSVRLVVDHSAEADFRLPGALWVGALSEGFVATVEEHYRGGSFVVQLSNQGMEQADCPYEWRREGLLQ